MSFHTNPYVARFDDEPSLLESSRQSQFEAACASLAAAFPVFEQKSQASNVAMTDDFWFAPEDWRSQYRPYKVRDGILSVNVKGVLLNNFGYQFFDIATGYQYIQKAIERGIADSDVKGIALIIDSPGGEVAGNFDLVDFIFASRGKKQIRAYASESAYSAAYSIASAADSITVARTGGVGSIGVVTAHLDISGALEKDGYVLTWIYAGKHKVDGNMYEPLKPETKKRIQAKIEYLYGIFVATVARNRNVDEQAVRDTEALTFTATEAISNGLADTVGSLDESLATFVADLSLEDEDENMANDNNVITAADHAKAITDARAEGFAAGKAEGKAEGKTEGLKEGAKVEQDRISAILGSDEAKKRPKAALTTALKTGLDVEAASAFLADLDEEKPAAAAPAKRGANETASAFEKRMAVDGNAEIGEPGEAEPDATAAFENRFEKAMSSVTGKKKAAA